MTVEVDTTAQAGTVPMTRARIGQAGLALLGLTRQDTAYGQLALAMGPLGIGDGPR
ncbi:hypothetical protein [Actinoallomurus sp. CA-142502]|uniref:hypothetical protein n=1 Tax=Actinoallomurus sp. CA-142502 TaxID=3239885 RepID=UPI003D8AF76E